MGRGQPHRSYSPKEAIGILSRLIARVGPLAKTIGGTLRFQIAGAEGGSWCVDLESGGWSTDELRADTIVYATAPAFSALITASPSVADHMKRGALIITGDREKLGRLGRLITSGGSAVAMRAATKERFKDESRHQSKERSARRLRARLPAEHAKRSP
jgi:hypothetical protein